MTARGLGRGLAALIPHSAKAPRGDPHAAIPLPPAGVSSRENGSGGLAGREALGDGHSHTIENIPVDAIDRSPDQPREEFPESELQDLARSLETHGVLQPLLVTKEGERYILVAGERRLRAAKRAGLASVPCLVHEGLTAQRRLEIALIENVQRADLNPVEQAVAYNRLQKEFGLTHDEIARAVGKERPTITNVLRLLELPADMQRALREAGLTLGQARGLLAIKDPKKRQEAFAQIQRGELSTRALERSTRKVRVVSHTRLQKDPQLALYEQELSRALGTRVRIQQIGDGGTIEIEYYSDEELGGIVEKVRGQ